MAVFAGVSIVITQRRACVIERVRRRAVVAVFTGVSIITRRKACITERVR